MASSEERMKENEALSYSMLHDLRAPLRAVNGFVGVLREDHADQLDGEGRRILEMVAKAAARMDRLIVDFIAFAQAGGAPLGASAVDTVETARVCFAELTEFAADTPPLLVMGALPPAVGDAAMIQQVFANLLGNAIKFCHGRVGARIDVTGWTTGEWNTYCVADNGAGFETAMAGRLFQAFQRLHDCREFEGNGIGLAFVRRVVRRHGGETWAEGKVNGGARFYFTLPAGTGGGL